MTTTDTSLDERYPEHAKLNEVKGKSQAIYDFLEWAGAKGYVFGQEITTEPLTSDEGADSFERFGTALGNLAQDSKFFRRAGESTLHQLLAEHFGIDPKKLEAEKLQMLDDMRALNAPKEA
jgi:hypothetical protein